MRKASAELGIALRTVKPGEHTDIQKDTKPEYDPELALFGLVTQTLLRNQRTGPAA